MVGRVLGQCFLKNHQGGFYRIMIGLLLLVITVPTVAVQSALAADNLLTTEERAWLKVNPGIMFGFFKLCIAGAIVLTKRNCRVYRFFIGFFSKSCSHYFQYQNGTAR